MRPHIDSRGQVKVVNARKPHECTVCGTEIQPKTDYILRSVRADTFGTFFHEFKYHPGCYDRTINPLLLGEEPESYSRDERNRKAEEALEDLRSRIVVALGKTLDDICECVGPTREYTEAKSGIRARFEATFLEWEQKYGGES